MPIITPEFRPSGGLTARGGGVVVTADSYTTTRFATDMGENLYRVKLVDEITTS